MGSLYRSEEMCLGQMFLQSEAAYACVAELGELGLVQFRDLNPDMNAFQRKYVNEVRRCDEMERKLRFIEKEISKSGIKIWDTGERPDAPAPRATTELETLLDKLENELREVNTNQEALKRNFIELTELKHILLKAHNFFEEAAYHHQNIQEPGRSEDTQSLLGEEAVMIGQPAMRLGFLTGVIQRERIPAFESMMWRVCRGNVFLRLAEIDEPLEDPSTGNQVQKSVFIIFFQGDQLKTLVRKICEGFRATLYPCHETKVERHETTLAVANRIEDLKIVLGQTEEHRQRVLASAAKNVRVWFIKVRKLKAIYHTLNLFNLDVTQKCLIAECWCPVTDLGKIQLALKRGSERSGSTVPSILNVIDTKKDPPTYNKTNKFTSVFQSLVDAYGVCTYGEVNPAPFTIITYPFLFSVMFGDFGHGFIMFLFGLWLVLRERQLHASLANHEMFGTIYGGRYMLLMMGIFSLYSGLIYNDCFSKSLNIFGSSWNVTAMFVDHENQTYPPWTEDLLDQEMSLTVDPRYSWHRNESYPFGVDPIWQLAANKISFLNSYKMKMSVVLGILQMLFGVILSYFNHRHFRKPLNVWCEFVPQLVFLISFFGYLVSLIFAKWLIFDATTANDAPSLIITLINMGLLTPPDPEMFAGQAELQICLLLVAMSCIPWMLIPKPLILRHQHKKKLRQGVSNGAKTERHHRHGMSENSELLHHDELQLEVAGLDDDDDDANHSEEEFDFGEVFVLQAIHTIEYCLGCISHTASYLRLWALSLAHAELSEVLWTMLLGIGLSVHTYLGAIMTWGVFAAWAVLTISILLFMEGLSAFLHTLRLHWVEFQSKFFKGEGHAFIPFSFDLILKQTEE